MLHRWRRTAALTLALLSLIVLPAAGAENLLRNGSFEGGLLYWHNIRPDNHQLVRGEAKVGRCALRIAKGYVASAPFEAERGESYTVSMFVRGDVPGTVRVSMPPSAREVGTRAKRLWCREGTQTAEVTTEWRRVSFTWLADVPPHGFWPLPHYIVHIGAGKTPIVVDGVSVTRGREGTGDYVPRREIEVVAECPDLPGYQGATANLFERGATVGVACHVSNPGADLREVMLRWQLYDYEGTRALGDAVEKVVAVPGGGMVSETAPLELVATGTVIARVSAVSVEGERRVIDSSDLPLTSLPYPKSATEPDWRERFGGSFAGGKGCVEKFQRVGFGWIRWRPHANGRDHLPVEPKPGEEWQWTWFDEELDEQEAHGCSAHICLYPPPDWIMEKGHPLPKDMRWAADDPRWEDLDFETTWDRFVRQAVVHYKGRSVIFEIENEPELNKWESRNLVEEYVRFTMRTARLIRRTDPAAKIMINNVYAIPSRLNAALFKAGGLAHIDVVSWHDYHAGWLADATAIRRMRQKLDEAGGRHVEIWFNEGWAFTNTLVDEPIACTGLSSAQSCNAIADSVAELTVNGQEKTILFHTAYETHGMSFWDYSGPGTMLWDWYDYPLPLVPAWNVLVHHVGLSEAVGFVRPLGANFCIFQDKRNGRGVMIAYADRDAREDARVELPDFGTPLMAEDIMGNARPAPSMLVLSKTGRPVVLYTQADTPGRVFLESLQPLDRKHASFVSVAGEGSELSWTLPAAWEGTEKGSSQGSVVRAGDQPVWKLEQLWPPDWRKPENYRPMVWTGTDWNVAEGGFGGQPGARLEGRALILGTRAPHGKPPARRWAGLTFVATRTGTYRLAGFAACRMWDGKNDTTLRLLRRTAEGVEPAGSIVIPHQGSASLDSLRVTLAEGEQFTLLPEIKGMYTGGSCRLSELRVTCGAEADPATKGVVYRLPAAWEGSEKGSHAGNPISARGKPIWRIDRVYPDDPHLAENYAPLPWDGTVWHAKDHQQGGQPKVQIENGAARISVAGPWENHAFQKIAGLVFIPPEGGVYRLRGSARTRPWTGKADSFRLVLLKKDTQRAVEVKAYTLPRSGTAVELDVRVELTEGHELVLLPLMPDWNNATATQIDGLEVTREE